MMRADRFSLTAASRIAGTTPRTVQRHAGTALQRRHDGRYLVAEFDRIPRTLRFITAKGLTDVTVHDSRVASAIARYMAAVNTYLNTGDRRALRPFRDSALKASGIVYPFITDSRTLERLAYVGEVSFTDLYALTTGEKK